MKYIIEFIKFYGVIFKDDQELSKCHRIVSNLSPRNEVIENKDGTKIVRKVYKHKGVFYTAAEVTKIIRKKIDVINTYLAQVTDIYFVKQDTVYLIVPIRKIAK